MSGGRCSGVGGDGAAAGFLAGACIGTRGRGVRVRSYPASRGGAIAEGYVSRVRYRR